MKKKYIYLVFALLMGLTLGITKTNNNYVIDGNNIYYLILSLLSYFILMTYDYKERDLKYIMTIFVVIIIGLVYFKVIFFKADFSIIYLSFLILIGSLIGSIIIYALYEIIALKKYQKLFKNRKRNILTLILSFILSLFIILGNLEESQSSINTFWEFKNIIPLLTNWFTLFILLLIIYRKLNLLKSSSLDQKKIKKYFFISFISFLVVFIFYYLANFPGVFTVDTINEIGQVKGLIPYSTHHPVLFTIIIALFSSLSSNFRLDMIIYCIFQMVIMAFTLSFLLCYLIKKNANKYLVVFFYIYFLTSPIIAMYSFTVWKDIPFAIVMVYYTIILIEMITNSKIFFSKKINLGYFIIASLGVMLLRNNGLYMWLLSIPIILLICYHNYKPLFLSIDAIIIIYLIFTIPIYNALGVRKGESGEALSIPLQQIARVYHYHEIDLTSLEKRRVERYLDTSKILYNPILSNYVKDYFENNYYDSNKKGFYAIWYELYKKYPDVYIDAFLSQGYGYWYPNELFWAIATGYDEGDPLYQIEYNLQTKAIYNIKNPNEVVWKIRNIPILSMIYSTAIPFWLLFITIIYAILKKNYKVLGIDLLFFIMFLTLIASPVYAEYRYLFSIVLCMPLIIYINCHVKKE